ncbi:MAG: M23 family metallopeptidase [Dyadobacter sp.]|uniref:M23 family metallopeptidase n=1 Tax=Dyadobacter sp. TaxID=1914288 RepID=UPI0032659970
MGQKPQGRDSDFSIGNGAEPIKLYFNGKFFWTENIVRNFRFLAVSGDWERSDIYNRVESKGWRISKGEYWINPSDFGPRKKPELMMSRVGTEKQSRNFSMPISKVNLHSYGGSADFFIQGQENYYYSSGSAINLAANFDRFVEIMQDELNQKPNCKIEVSVGYHNEFKIRKPLTFMSIRMYQFGRYDPASNLFGAGVRREGKGDHWGWDLIAPVGTAVFAIADGKISEIYPDLKGYGLCVVQEFECDRTKLYVLYAHMDQIDVKSGDEILIGRIIGRTGRSGITLPMPEDENHLHLEISKLKVPQGGGAGRIDPVRIFGPVAIQSKKIENQQ